MTNEQAIKWLKEALKTTDFQYEQMEKAVEMAIQALEQEPYICDTCKHKDAEWDTEPCDGCCKNHSGYEPTDAISRDAVWGIIMRSDFVDRFTYQEFTKKLDALPNVPVTQKSCEDAVSREAVLEIICRETEWYDIRTQIEQLPSVRPQEQTGQWIAQDIYNCHTDFKCSECGYIHSFMHLYGEPSADYTYCPNCGAKMESEEQTE